MARQSNSATPFSGTIQNISYSLDVLPGSFLSAYCVGQPVLDPSIGVSDSLSNIWNRAVFINESLEQLSLWYCAGSKGGANTVTFTFTGTISFAQCIIAEHLNIVTQNPLDQTITNRQLNITTAPGAGTTGTVITTTGGRQLILVGVARFGGSGVATSIVSPFTLIADPFGDSPFAEYTQPTPGAIAGTFTADAADNDYISVLASFKMKPVINPFPKPSRPRPFAPGIAR